MVEPASSARDPDGVLERLFGSRLFGSLFLILAMVLAVVAVAGLVFAFLAVLPAVPEDYHFLAVLGAVFLTVISVGLAALVFLAAVLVRLRRESMRHLGRFVPPVQVSGSSGSLDGRVVAEHLAQLNEAMVRAADLLHEINENTLLDQEGRARKYELLARTQREEAFRQVERHIRDRNWAQARAVLEGLEHKYPGNHDVRQHLTRLDGLRKAAFDEDYARVKKRIDDLIAISAWDKAAIQAEALLEQHPDSERAKELVIHVSQQRQKFRDEQLKRISADIQKNVTRKHWNEALQAARQLLERYPDSVEAEAVENQIPTLEKNAEIERRQQLEEQIRDLVQRRNFIQAVELARHVIETYPDSPQASALAQQMARFEDLARQQEKELQL